MKLLLDENISHRIVPALKESFPDSTQVRFLGIAGATDKAVWDYARKHDYAIVTLDADFHECSLLWGKPPLIIWLRCGNQRKEILLNKLLSNRDVIENAATDSNIRCLEMR